MELKKLLAERIRATREQLGLTQNQLAEMAGFSSAQIISQIEKAERDIKAWELLNLAKALKTDVAVLLAENSSTPTANVLWRKMPTQNRQLLESDFLQRCQEYALVEKLNDIKIGYQLPVITVDLSSMTFQDAEKMGREIRDSLGLGNRPASSLSNMLENKYGVKIWYANLGEDGSAASTKGPFGLGVLINSAEAPWRRNYSFAHELFHLLTWDAVALTEQTKGESSDRTEKLAEAFASTLLLPDTEIEELLKNRVKENKIEYAGLVEIAREFGVSTIALLRRLKNLRYLNSDTVHNLENDPDFQQLDRNVRNGAWNMPPAIPERFVRLAFMAFQNGKLSRAKLAEFLKASLLDLSDFLLEYGLDDSKDYKTVVHTGGR
jgi:Zn-dependent peptidase ImmA (M78 family)/DNA-binding XRE family transcriptional regulator